MLFSLSRLAVTAGLLASVSALTVHDIPTDTPVSSLLSSAQAHLKNGETSEALLYYDAAVARDPADYLTLFKRATTFLSLGRLGQATNDFNRVLDLRPGFEGAHLQLAKLKSRNGDWEGARSGYLAGGKGEDTPELVDLADAQKAATLVELAVENSNWGDCITHANTAIVVATRAIHLRELRSRCRFERGELEEGMGDLQHVLHLRPGDTDPHVLISATNFYALGDMENGMAHVRKCLHSDPDSKVCKKLHRQQKNTYKAMSKAEGLLAKGLHTSARRSLVGSEVDEEAGLLKDVQEQAEELKQAGRIPPKASNQLYEKLIDMACQIHTESNHKEADHFCNESLERSPESFWGLIHQGKSLMRQEDFDGSIRSFEKAAEMDPARREKVNPLLQKAKVALKRSKSKDYYKVLGVAHDADEKQIKSAYRKATKLHHPDKAVNQGISREDAEKKMAAINEAYEVLSDAELRARFDRGDDPNSHEQGSPFQGSSHGHGGHPFMYHQQGSGNPGGSRGGFKFNFGGGGGGGGPFGF